VLENVASMKYESHKMFLIIFGQILKLQFLPENMITISYEHIF